MRGISDGVLLSSDPTVRSFAVSRARAAGATVFRIPVDWRARTNSTGSAVGESAVQTSHLATVDAAVREAVNAGLQPLLVVSRAPASAEAQPRWPYAYSGTWSPNPIAFKEFAEVLARRYSGTFPDPLAPGQSLPQVKLFQAWNEPNLSRYLAPQWVGAEGHWSAFSPGIYRQLLNAFYAGVKSVDPSDVVV
ncbi:MAG: glycoside hydrolase family 5 protein, partial [Solirubrobacteraceae bacterium]